jgi:hypothetical protein
MTLPLSRLAGEGRGEGIPAWRGRGRAPTKLPGVA